MKAPKLPIDRLITERLVLIPLTTKICKDILKDDFSNLLALGLKKGKGWPDADVMETLPRIIDNLSKVEEPTGFESWMIIKNDTLEIIGDAGFKGYNGEEKRIDIGYGITREERRKGFAEEAVTELIRWAFSTGVVSEITARCLPDNANSINFLQKLSFTKIKQDTEMMYWSLRK
ncbi:GNAT family N-acetyltransferase [Chryseobacterium shigense]|uniref:Ribosomal-protein-alanine N-acetyltransferase n=1 Tax=Chryseobacterium shigense TaxID=297244 RepID=A0A1N7IT25_9FLAO|nr:GNAT family N-acetyltransferase [Chryseobacterium shigense]PQA92459.1 GNAT family N-acetyltransferase [Chryseobacterium shigense]SIS40190.1 ribosomal-protein-alanine N-acetyltransferase [Chryseobacterium shigense]